MTAQAGPDDAEAGHGQLGRTLNVIELLAHNARGLKLFEIADTLRIPRSATHRVLARLVERGYVRQEGAQGSYLLTAKLVSLGFTFLAGSGVPEIVQPVLERLARETGELTRLAVLDGERLTFVAKAHGTPGAVLYDADMGQLKRLSCSASGLAWLATLDDAAALEIVRREGFGSRTEFGPNAPETPATFLKALRATRRRGYAVTQRTFSPVMSAMAAALRRPGTGEVTGTLTLAGPWQRLTEARMHAIAPVVLAAAHELSRAMSTSQVLFGRGHVRFAT